MQVIEKLEKLYNLYVGKGATAGERNNAHAAMVKIAKKHKVNLAEFIAGKDFDREFASRAAEKAAAAEEARKAAEAKEAGPEKRPSRRAFIIRTLNENIWDSDSLSQVLSDLGYGEVKTCKKAVAGTMYDLSTNRGFFYRKCADGRICVEKPSARA